MIIIWWSLRAVMRIRWWQTSIRDRREHHHGRWTRQLVKHIMKAKGSEEDEEEEAKMEEKKKFIIEWWVTKTLLLLLLIKQVYRFRFMSVSCFHFILSFFYCCWFVTWLQNYLCVSIFGDESEHKIEFDKTWEVFAFLKECQWINLCGDTIQ